MRRDGEATDSTIGVANHLIDDKNFIYTYGNNGNLIRKTDKATNVTTDYTYDAENRLIRIDLPNGSVAQYRYDGLGRRIEKDVDSIVSRYVYDSEDILLEFDGTNTQTARYTHGLGTDEPLIMERGGQGLFYHSDGLGSITDLTDTNGIVAQSYIYDSFGNIDQQVGTLSNPYTYTGRELDSESGLYYYRARYYDPSIGRFINEDPIGFAGGSANFYGYVQNNPVNFIDPDGLEIFLLGTRGAYNRWTLRPGQYGLRRIAQKPLKEANAPTNKTCPKPVPKRPFEDGIGKDIINKTNPQKLPRWLWWFEFVKALNPFTPGPSDVFVIPPLDASGAIITEG